MLTIPLNLIRAAIPCAATNDVRYYLNGAYFVWTVADHTLRVISTDGNLMSCFSVRMPECETPDFDLIIPVDTLKPAAKVKTLALQLSSVDEKRYTLGEFMFSPVDAKFPDYRRVIPQTLSGEAGDFWPELLERAANALCAYYKASKTQVYHMDQNGKRGAAVMHNGESDAIVVIMPTNVNPKGDLPVYKGFN